MGRRVADGAALSFVLVLVAACTDDGASPPSTFTPGEVTHETRPPPTVDEPPSGACNDEGAEQTVRTRAGADACRVAEAGAFVPSVPNTWRCASTSGQWRCEITHGGFGTVQCP
jgi:hypothetical protein